MSIALLFVVSITVASPMSDATWLSCFMVMVSETDIERRGGILYLFIDGPDRQTVYE